MNSTVSAFHPAAPAPSPSPLPLTALSACGVELRQLVGGDVVVAGDEPLRVLEEESLFPPLRVGVVQPQGHPAIVADAGVHPPLPQRLLVGVIAAGSPQA